MVPNRKEAQLWFASSGGEGQREKGFRASSRSGFGNGAQRLSSARGSSRFLRKPISRRWFHQTGTIGPQVVCHGLDAADLGADSFSSPELGDFVMNESFAEPEYLNGGCRCGPNLAWGQNSIFHCHVESSDWIEQASFTKVALQFCNHANNFQGER